MICSRDVDNSKMEPRRRNTLFTCSAVVLLCLFVAPAHSSQSDTLVHSFKRSLTDVQRSSRDVNFLSLLRKRRSAEVTDTESERQDSKCEDQKRNFQDLRDKLSSGESRLEETHVFVNESKYNLALAWAGENDEGILLVLTSETHILSPDESTLWRSTDNGRTWKDWSSKVDNKVFRKNDGLQRNPSNPKKVYLISYEHYIYVTEDGGETWRRSQLTDDADSSITVEDQLEFHPEPEYENYVLVVSSERKLYVTYENFKTNPKEIAKNVHIVKWGTKETNKEKCIYVAVDDSDYFTRIGPEMFELRRYCDGTWKTILSRVLLFNVEGKFVYASIFKSERPKNEEEDRLMMISTDGGDTWNEAQLPTLTGDRFFSVLDMSENLIFMHVDNPGDTGHGTLYTSSSDGIVYSESLQNHLFPNYNTVHDFYKVESIRGVYLASQMSVDKSIHTVITYNRGGDWKNISRPVDVECKNDEKEGCFLQIHNAYSVHRGINAQLPKSQGEAYGLVLAHGHVASNLQTTDPDVFLSTDGGYNFKRVLKGPHAYEIADSGGLLVAVPTSTDYPDTIKFSTDEGNCWHTYKFTEDPIKFTGLLTEPGGKSMTVSIWGYHKDTKKWTINIIDFNKVVTQECYETDYISWTPHTSMNQGTANEGCLLGKKETFKKIKPDSWCRNGYSKSRDVRRDACACTSEDYECDFGFYRPEGSTKCVRQTEIKSTDIELCKDHKLDKVVTLGYRKVPGDECEGGFKPDSELVTLGDICKDGDQKAEKHDLVAPPKNTGSGGKLVIAAIIVIVLVLVAIVGAFFTYKMVLLRRHKVVYRYSMLNQTDNRDDEFENALTTHDTLYRDSSDEEVEQENRSPQHANGSVPGRNKQQQAPVKSYHDDSDDDMLG